MSPVAAVCLVHGPFESRAFSSVGSQNVAFKGVTEQCPKCGLPSKVMEGSFDFDDQGFASVVSAPLWSMQALKTVQDRIRRAAREIEVAPAEQVSDLVNGLKNELQEFQLRNKARDDEHSERTGQLIKAVTELSKQIANQPTGASPPSPKRIASLLRRFLGFSGGVATSITASYVYDLIKEALAS